jgi:hypothetical protein
MTTSDTILPTAESLSGELEILVDEILIVERQLEELRAEREAAIAAEHEAGEALRAAEAVFAPLMLATKQGDQQAIYAVGGSMWAASFPKVAQAHGEVQACRDVCQKASARTDMLHRAVRDVERRKLPGLQTAAFDKQQELEAFRASQARAVETRDATLKASLAAFKRRLRGEKA